MDVERGNRLSNLYELPSVYELLYARSWVLAGCPAAAKDHDAPEAARVLMKLFNALPGHLPVYCYGTPEYKADTERSNRIRRGETNE